jgi:hypothetical protein
MKTMSKIAKDAKSQIKSEQIAKQRIKTEQSKKSETKIDPVQQFFTTYKQNIEKYFAVMEKSTPKYYQTLIEIQQEYVQTLENMLNSAMMVQKEFASNTGMDSRQSIAASKFVSDATESAIKAKTVRDEIIFSSLDVIKENIKEWNKQSQVFLDMNRKNAQFWISTFMTRHS